MAQHCGARRLLGSLATYTLNTWLLNVLLYGICLEGLNDITSGSNPGCNTDGFSAIPGWDPVTGLGSLDFERLVAILSG
ncbi:hypothetical protein EDB89DRAFT_2128850 [Lactarius sanguifluus]|nr:hypothetical protein EDB89DRAFT_2128850 [Lactarius sanguifluus]